MHSEPAWAGGPVLVRSGPTTGKRGAAANREPGTERASRACTMKTILERERGNKEGGSSRSTWLLISGGLVLISGARAVAKPLYAPLSRQPA